MFDKPQATHTLGLDIDGLSLKGVALSTSRGQPKFDSAFELAIEPTSLPTADHVKPLYTEEQKEQLMQLATKNLIVTSLGPQEVIVRPLELKVKKEKDIDTVLTFQSEPLIPYSAENALVDKIILSKDKEGYRLSVIAARKDHLSCHIKQWNSLDIEPETVTAAPCALALFTKHFAEQDTPLYALHIGLNHTLCILVSKGKLLAAQGMNKGVESLVQAFMQGKTINRESAYKELSLAEFNDHSPQAIKDTLESLRLDVTRTLFALAKQAKGETVERILLTGEGAYFSNLKDILCKPLNKTILIPASTPLFPIDSNQLQQFALPIGLGLSALPKCQEPINFRQNEFVYPAPWKRLKQPLGLYLGLCFGIAITLVLFGKAYLSYQEADLKKQYLELLNIMNKPYTQFEKEFIVKTTPGDGDISDTVIPIKNLTQEQITNRLNFLEKELQSMPQFYPLQPNVPSVSDVLAWISTHPNVVQKTSDTTPAQALHIENFSYTMLKRPELSRKKEKYQVKVEFEFASPTPKMAREFHDALITPNAIVDPKGEVKWSSNRDNYRTSFYLKDKTLYPN